ncbi:metal-dependent hydrolase [Aquirhabdus parva]|uniref:metal-dependent hydrolase n=1 Tax=Aquirhabdus parva TaxID=2283318 RepID=UPI0013B375FC|nr:metal-dependent hydrolase [Aquirhabdus parva]
MNTVVHDITVRHQKFSFDGLKKYYFSKNPFLTHYLSVLSLTFPEGERMFVHSVRAVRDRITDPILQKEVSAFIGQEAIHGNVHEAFNTYVQKNLGVKTQKYQKEIFNQIKQAKEKIPKKHLLAMTCGFEHLTAILGEHMLTHPEEFDDLDPIVRPMWFWHALEETEHKAVAFDVYQHVYHDEETRLRMMKIITRIFIARILMMTVMISLKDKNARFNVRKNAIAMKRLGSIVRSITPAYKAYFSPTFHPNDRDTTALTKAWRERLFPSGNEQMTAIYDKTS